MTAIPDSSFQSIWLPVREVDALVDEFRVDGDWSRQLGVPAHITLAGPWPISRTLPDAKLAELATAARGTRYRLNSVEVLGDAICMLPDDGRPLTQWRERLVAAVDGVDAADPSWRPHLTICRSASRDSLKAIRKAVNHALPVNCVVRDLRLSRLVEPGLVSVESL
jgi:hypothetical protein